MALQKFKDTKGNDMFYDPDAKKVLSEGGTKDTFYTSPDEWNQRQSNEIDKEYKTKISQADQEIQSLNKEIDTRNKAYAEQESLINNNPFYAEATRVGKVEKLDTKYQRDVANLIADRDNKVTTRDTYSNELKSIYERTAQEKEASKPTVQTYQDANGNQILTTIDPYTGNVLSTQNLGGGKAKSTSVYDILNKTKAAKSGTQKQPAPGAVAVSTMTDGSVKYSDGTIVRQTTPQVPASIPSSTPQTPQVTQTFKQDNLITSLAKGFVEGGKQYGGFLGDAAVLGLTRLTPRYRELDAKLTNGTASISELQEFEALNTAAFGKTEDYATDKIVGTTLKKTAAGASYLIPGGVGTKVLGKVGGMALAGGLTSGLTSASMEDATPEEVITSVFLGSATGGLLSFAGMGTKALANKIKPVLKSTGQKISSMAAAKTLKTSATAFMKAADNGVNINEAVVKYNLVGKDYDELLGAIAKNKPKGSPKGIINDLINAEEVKIQRVATNAGNNIKITTAGEEIADVLKQKAKEVSKELGVTTPGRVKAINEIVKQVSNKYKKGITVKNALVTLREANERFGKSIIETEKGAIDTAAQKIEANTLRSILKKMFPEIKDALDNQSELLTIRPLLEHARGVEKTAGLRFGLTNTMVTLTAALSGNPLLAGGLAAGKAAIDDPNALKRIGSTMERLGEKIPKISNQTANKVNDYSRNQVISRVSAGVSDSLLPSSSPVNPEGYGNEKTQDVIPHDDPSISQQQFVDSFGYAPEDYAAAIKADIMETGGENQEQLMQMYNISVKEQERMGKLNEVNDTNLSDKQRSFIGASRLARGIKSILEKSPNSIKVGPIAGRASGIDAMTGQESVEQTNLKTYIASARTMARNALLGANMSEQEIQSYLDANLDINLPYKTLMQKVDAFIYTMETMAVTDIGVEPIQIVQ